MESHITLNQLKKAKHLRKMDEQARKLKLEQVKNVYQLNFLLNHLNFQEIKERLARIKEKEAKEKELRLLIQKMTK